MPAASLLGPPGMTLPVRGSTVVTGVLGWPVGHSQSPAIFNAAYAAAGLDWVYVAFPVPPGAGGDAVRALPVLGVAGVSVTMPHKADAAAACDDRSAAVAALAAANLVTVREGRIVGDSTDGAGFLDAAAEAGVELADARVLVLGAGGAARAIVRALGDIGAAVTVAARRPEAARDAATLAVDAEAVALDQAAAALAGTNVLVNATPVGMHGEGPPVDTQAIESRHVVIDTIYVPEETPLLAAARARGARTLNGLGMLVHQAAHAFLTFTGEDAPLPVMWAAARGDA